MELTGEKVISAPQARVYDALHDPVILRQALPGVQSLTKQGDGRFAITAALKVGPLKPTFTGIIEVYNEDRPAGYSLRGEGNGGNAGSFGGNAHVALAAVDGETTNLAYHLTAELSGQIASLEGVRLDVTARTLIAEFFARLQSILDGELVESETEAVAPAPVARAPAVAAPATVATPAAIAAPVPEPVVEAPPAVAEGPYQTPRYLPHSTYAEIDEDTAPQSAATTDATGGFVAPSPSSGAYDRLPLATTPAGSLPQAPYSGTRQTLETGTTAVHDGGGGGVGRWLMVAVGLGAIALLLNGGFGV